ncbi:RICIN domain-containing protein [Pseudomonas gingeri]|uniref:RICIN domain-containing protein n=1 Tax=Pseudomonas gingeri TaxID=117681 RepID=A0A7Y7WQV9_9PSED|nr:RICIN domain-containing protein [Pseudomonas gingeri]NWB85898.1 RICIN domain-containing protein [Pseudomonas gingeri]
MKDEAIPRDATGPEKTAKGAPGGAVEIEEGIYKIYTNLNNTSVVDMAVSGSDQRVHRIKLYHDNSSLESTWGLLRRPGGYYLLINQREKDLAAGEMKDDSVGASPITERPAQLWMFKSAGPDLYYLENKYDGKVMDVAGSHTEDNSSIINYRHVGSKNQKFKLLKIDGPK